MTRQAFKPVLERTQFLPQAAAKSAAPFSPSMKASCDESNHHSKTYAGRQQGGKALVTCGVNCASDPGLMLDIEP